MTASLDRCRDERDFPAASSPQPPRHHRESDEASCENSVRQPFKLSGSYVEQALESHRGTQALDTFCHRTLNQVRIVILGLSALTVS